MIELSDRQIDVLCHSLGLNYSKKMYRNYFCAEPGHFDWGVLQELVGLGLMECRGEDRFSSLIVFVVTEEGKRVCQRV